MTLQKQCEIEDEKQKTNSISSSPGSIVAEVFPINFNQQLSIDFVATDTNFAKLLSRYRIFQVGAFAAKTAIHYRFASKKRTGRSPRIEAKLAAFWSRRVSRSKRAGVAVLVDCQKNQKNSIRLNMERSLPQQSHSIRDTMDIIKDLLSLKFM